MARLSEFSFSDVHLTPDNRLYIHDGKTKFGLMVIEIDDLEMFKQTLVKSWRGRSSYSMMYDNTVYRVEKVDSLNGVHYSVRRMPKTIPDFSRIGMPEEFTRYMLSLGQSSGLVLWGGATGA